MNNLRNKKKLIAAMLVVPAIAGLAQAAFAGPLAGSLIDKDFETALRKFATKRFFNRIDATDEQRTKISTLMDKTMEDTRPDREQVRQGLLNLSDLMASKDATDDQIKAKVGEVKALRQKIQDRRLTTVLEVRKILTQDQRQKIHDRVQDLISGNAKPLRRISMLMEE